MSVSVSVSTTVQQSSLDDNLDRQLLYVRPNRRVVLERLELPPIYDGLQLVSRATVSPGSSQSLTEIILSFAMLAEENSHFDSDVFNNCSYISSSYMHEQ